MGIGQLVGRVGLFGTGCGDRLGRGRCSNSFLGRGDELVRVVASFFPFALAATSSLPGGFCRCEGNGRGFSCIVVSRTARYSIVSKLPILFCTGRYIVSNSDGRLDTVAKGGRFSVSSSGVSRGFGCFDGSFLGTAGSTFYTRPALLGRRCEYSCGVVGCYGHFFCGGRLVVCGDTGISTVRLVSMSRNGCSCCSSSSFDGRQRVCTVGRRYSKGLSCSCIVAPFGGRGRLLGGRFSDCGSGYKAVRSFRNEKGRGICFSAILGSLSFYGGRLSDGRGLFASRLIGITISETGDGFILIASGGCFSRHSRLVGGLVLCVSGCNGRVPSGAIYLFSCLCGRVPACIRMGGYDGPFRLGIFRALRGFYSRRGNFSIFTGLPLTRLIASRCCLGARGRVEHFILGREARISFAVIGTLRGPILTVRLSKRRRGDRVRVRESVGGGGTLRRVGVPLGQVGSGSTFYRRSLVDVIRDSIYGTSTAGGCLWGEGGLFFLLVGRGDVSTRVLFYSIVVHWVLVAPGILEARLAEVTGVGANTVRLVVALWGFFSLGLPLDSVSSMVILNLVTGPAVVRMGGPAAKEEVLFRAGSEGSEVPVFVVIGFYRVLGPGTRRVPDDDIWTWAGEITLFLSVLCLSMVPTAVTSVARARLIDTTGDAGEGGTTPVGLPVSVPTGALNEMSGVELKP